MNIKEFLFFLLFPILLFPYSSEAIDQKEVQKLLAKTYEAQGDPEKAISLYEEMLMKDPLDIEVRKNVAELLTWEKRYEEAIAQYTEVLALAPRDGETMKKLASVYKIAHQFKKAEQLYLHALQEYPDDPELSLGLGELFIWERRYEEALQYFRKVIEKEGPKEAKILYARAILYSGDPEKAKQLLLEMEQEEPHNRQVETYLADCYAYNQQFAVAIEKYKKLLAEKESPFIKNKLAEALSWNKHYKEAIELYDEMLQEQYEVALQRQKARVLGWAQQYDKAEEEYKNILKRKYDSSIALEMEAKAAYWDGRWMMAEKRYRELLALEPDNVEALFDMSQMYSYRLE